MVLTRAFVRARSACLHTCGQRLPVLVAALLRPQRARVHEVSRVLIWPEEEHLNVRSAHSECSVRAVKGVSAHSAALCNYACAGARVHACERA